MKKIILIILVIIICGGGITVVVINNNNNKKNEPVASSNQISSSENQVSKTSNNDEEISKEDIKKVSTLEAYFGKDVKIVGEMLGLNDETSTAGIEYNNDELVIGGDEKDRITFISLLKGSGKKYSIYGVEIGMSIEEFDSILKKNGYIEGSSSNIQNNNYHYTDEDGNSLRVLCDSNNMVNEVMVWKK